MGLGLWALRTERQIDSIHCPKFKHIYHDLFPYRRESVAFFFSSQLWERKGRVPLKGDNVCSVHYEE